MKPTTHQLAQEELKEILRETGHTLTPEDLPKVLKLSELCAKVQCPDDEGSFDLLRMPVRVGDTEVVLRPLTIARASWISQNAGTWGNDAREYAAVCYALSVTDSRALFACPADDLADDVDDMLASLDVDTEALERAVSKVMPEATEDQGKGESDVYGPLVAAMCNEYGSRPEYWLHDCDIETIQALVDAMVKKQEAELQAAQRSNRKATTAGPEKFRAVQRLRDYRNQLIAEWSATDGE